MKQPKLLDPRTMYHAETFPSQEQGSPALQQRMTPRPDCGEESYQGSQQLQYRNALVTGGDSGIGRAAAIAFAREGANVAIQFFPGEEADAEEVRQIIEAEGGKALLLPADLREDKVATEIVEKTVEAFGQLDILVLNAAQQFAQPSLEALSIQQVEETFKVNIISMYETVKAAERHLPVGSTIITTTSATATDPSTTLLDYSATNAAISNFTVNLSNYFAPKGIRVNSVSPGPIWTPLQLDGGQLEGKVESFGQSTLLGRAGQPVELAPVYVLLASNQSSFITGQIYGVTGGATINL